MPQTEIGEYMARRMPEVGGVFIQSESEVAAVNMVFGAVVAGARSETLAQRSVAPLTTTATPRRAN